MKIKLRVEFKRNSYHTLTIEESSIDKAMLKLSNAFDYFKENDVPAQLVLKQAFMLGQFTSGKCVVCSNKTSRESISKDKPFTHSGYMNRKIGTSGITIPICSRCDKVVSTMIRAGEMTSWNFGEVIVSLRQDIRYESKHAPVKKGAPKKKALKAPINNTALTL